MKTLSFIVWALVISSGWSQNTPAPPQTQPILITGGTAHLGNGRIIENAAIAFEEGKLTNVSTNSSFTQDRSKYKLIDASGKHIYPGFVALNTQLGLKEIDLVRATRDYAETGPLNPNVRALIAYNTDSKVTPTIRSRGVLLAQITPTSGRISGLSSVVQLDAWNWEDAAYRADEGIHLNWPGIYKFRGWWTTNEEVKNKNYTDQVQELRDFFNEAKSYQSLPTDKITNLRFEAMAAVFNGTRSLYIHTQHARTIMEAVLFAKDYGITPVVVGGRDSWMITRFLKKHNVPIILRQPQSLPGRTDADIDQPFKTPALLHKAGILFALSMNGSWQQRNLPFQGGQAVGFGLPYEYAIQALSLNAAEILGIADRSGSLEEGKDATLFICSGDVLDMRSSQVEQAFIQGREIDLDNKQNALYRKFKKKYEPQ